MTDIWDSDSDDEHGMEEMSPPKTMQFHIPQSRLLRTPGTFCFAFILIVDLSGSARSLFYVPTPPMLFYLVLHRASISYLDRFH